MALQKEIWLSDIIEGLFADNTFAARSLNHSAFVNNKTVHVPNAGTPPTVVKGRSKLPATATKRTDSDLTYQIGEFTSDPILIPNAEQVELSYDKRQSIIRACRSALLDAVHGDLLLSWAQAANNPVQLTADQKKDVKGLILGVKESFDGADIPQVGRCIILTPTMYNTLLRQLTEFEGQSFILSADAQKGIVGKLYGFDVYMRSNLGTSDTKSFDVIAWHEDSVSRALGQTDLFVDERSALYYGDIISALVRAGGAAVRHDKKGLYAGYTVKQ